MANRPTITERNRRYFLDVVKPTFLRLAEDGKIDGAEVPELAEVINGCGAFADCIATTGYSAQSMWRAEDPEYIGDLMAMQKAAMRGLPDCA